MQYSLKEACQQEGTADIANCFILLYPRAEQQKYYPNAGPEAGGFPYQSKGSVCTAEYPKLCI